MYFYTAYNLPIQSELCLPELEPGMSGNEVAIRLGRVKQPPDLIENEGHWSWADDKEIILYWSQVGKFSIRYGREIIVDREASVSGERLRLFLLGAVMGALLQQRGLGVFHASAAALNDEAVVFLGGKGWGKSTMAATLHGLGYDLVADDVIAVDFSQGQPMVLPGFRQIKLWPDTLARLGQNAEMLPRLHPEFEKRDYRPIQGFSGRPLLLKRMYLLGMDEALTIEPVSGIEALLQLLPHWYCARFHSRVLQNLGLGSQFLQCVHLVKQVPMYRLKRPQALDRLIEVGRLVREHDHLDVER